MSESEIQVSPNSPAKKPLLSRISKIWVNYIKSQFILILVIFLMTLIFGKIVGLPYILPLAILAGIGEAIPTFGPIIAAIPAVIIALIKGSTCLPVSPYIFALIIIGVNVLIQLLENWFIKPKIIGDAVDIHPIIAFVGMTFFSSFLGIVGMLLAVPVMASVREIFQYYFYETH